jgi:hypothetical protein
MTARNVTTTYLAPKPEDCQRCSVDWEQGQIVIEILLRAVGGPGPTVSHGAILKLAELPVDVADALGKLQALAAARAASDFGYDRDEREEPVVNTRAPESVRPS